VTFGPTAALYWPLADWAGKATRKVWSSSGVMTNVAGSSRPAGVVTATWLGVNELASIGSLKAIWKEETAVFSSPVGLKLTTTGGRVSRTVMLKVRVADSGGVPSLVTRTVTA